MESKTTKILPEGIDLIIMFCQFVVGGISIWLLIYFPVSFKFLPFFIFGLIFMALIFTSQSVGEKEEGEYGN